MIDFKFAKNLKPGDTISVIVYGGKLQAGIFKGISKLGTVQYYGLRANPDYRGTVSNDKIQGQNLDSRVTKVALQDLSSDLQADYHEVMKQVQHLIKR